MNATSDTLSSALPILDWRALDASARAAALRRPASTQSTDVAVTVSRIFEQVRHDGESALRALTRRYDGVELACFAVSDEEIAAAEAMLDEDVKRAMGAAKQRIAAFHRATAPCEVVVDTAPGVVCRRILRPIEPVGLYVPSGTAPLPSTALMLGVPAQLAGCRNAVLCTPANAGGQVDAAVLYAAALCGIHRVFKLGGAQAIAAMTYGVGPVPACVKLFGPGNAYVTEAKRQASVLSEGPAIDMPAGPSEVLVIADAEADARFVAADLLSQAEHGTDSQVVLIATQRRLLDDVRAQLLHQLMLLPRRDIATQSLQCSRLILTQSLDAAFAISNAYAPEHLILHLRDASRSLERVCNAGSVFLGDWSPEAVGDYCSGTNHVLPTYGFARAWSGVSVASFVKQISVQELSPDGLRVIGPDAALLARAEGLHAHERAVTLRLAALEESVDETA